VSGLRENLAEPRHRLTKQQAVRQFYDVLLPDPDPASMDIAVDLCEEYGLKLADLGKSMAIEAYENRRMSSLRGWATDWTRKHSTGQFVLSVDPEPFRVAMRPPKRGERGWWVEARTAKGAELEIVRESEEIGWIAERDHDSRPDENGMIAVTIEPNPDYIAVGWMVWKARIREGGRLGKPADSPLFRIEIWIAYGGTSWDEHSDAWKRGVVGSRGVSGPLIEQLRTSNQNARLQDVQEMPSILPFDGGSTLAIAERRAVELTWRIALHEDGMLDSNELDSAGRPSGPPRYPAPPRVTINPRDNASGNREVVSRDSGLEGIFAREEDAQFYADELRRTGVLGVAVRRRGRELARTPAAAQNPPAMTRDEAALAFMRIIREPGVESMQIAEDIVLEYRLPLVELSEAGRTSDSTRGAYIISPAEIGAPIDSIEWEVEKLTLPPMYGGSRASSSRWGIGFKFTWHDRDEWLLVPSSSRYLTTRDAAERTAAADGWALAKQLKRAQVDEAALSPTVTTRWEEVLRELRRVLQHSYVDKTAPEVYQLRASPQGGLPKKKRTYAEARDDIWAALQRAGWSMSLPSLKLPHATSPNGKLRLWFKPQSVHATMSAAGRHEAGNARAISYDLDIRTMSPSEFLSFIQERFPQGFA
jgi:lambda repressor-like predicted transcriptional regulator